MGKGLSRAERNIRWIEDYCRIPEGKFVGRPVRLAAFQKKVLKGIYGSDTRLAIISYGRKNAKTTLAAFIVLLHTVGPEAVPNSQLYSAAQAQEQAALLYELMAKMVRMNPDLDSVLKLRDSTYTMLCPEIGTVYKALSAEKKTAYGKSPVLVIHDELGQVVGPRSQLYEALETAQSAHDKPLSIIISTQAPTDADLLSVLIDDAKTGADPKTKLFLWAAEEDLDPFSKKAIKAANPAFDHFMNQEEVMGQAQSAKRMPAREAAYRNLVLNQRVNQMSPFIPASIWKACGGKPDDNAFRTGKVQMGLDLSARHDLTALVYLAEREGVSHVRAEFFVPLDGIVERSQRDRVPYDQWHQMGLITATPGASVDYESVAKRLIELCDDYDVESIAFDRWRIDVLNKELDRLGVELPLKPFGQGFKDMAPALDVLESALMNGKVLHGNHPVLTMCCSNSIVDTDPAGNRKLNKAKSTGRIDGMVALAMAMGIHEKQETPEYQVFFA